MAGAVLVFALLVLVVAATILGGVAQLAVTQSVAGQGEWNSAARRIQVENSRALARQYILSQMFLGSGRLSRGSLDAGLLGKFSVTSVEPDSVFWNSVDQDGDDRINPFNIFERGGFQSAWVNGQLFAGTNSAGTNNVTWGFQVRTRSPIVAGFAFVNHRNVTNGWTASRYINMQQTNYATGVASLPLPPVSSVTAAAIGGAGGYTGLLSVPPSEPRFGRIGVDVRGVTTNPIVVGTNTNAEIVLNLFDYTHDNLGVCVFYPVPSTADLTYLFTNEIGVVETKTNQGVPVKQLVLRGTVQAGLPVQVVAANTNLAKLVLDGDNYRRVYFYQPATNSPLTVTGTNGARNFCIGMTLYSPADFALSGGLTIVGGVRTDRGVANSSGAVTFLPDSSPSVGYDNIADRMMWLEDQRAR